MLIPIHPPPFNILLNVKSNSALCHGDVWGSGGIDLLARGKWPTSRPCRFTPGERAPGTHWIGGWVGRRAGLNDVERRKFLTRPALEIRPLCLRARSQSLYRLRSLF
jgi:hypothetical protein